MELNLGDLTVSSPAFEHGSRIPQRHTLAGDSISPPLAWADPPEGTRSFALFVHDPDAPLVSGFTHWTVWGIPADVTALDEGEDTYPSGTNGTGSVGWFPPAPPPGHGDHCYFFHLYALDTELDLAPGADTDAFLAAIDGHVIEQARVVGLHRTG